MVKLALTILISSMFDNNHWFDYHFDCSYINCSHINCSYINYSYINCSYINCSYINCSYIMYLSVMYQENELISIHPLTVTKTLVFCVYEYFTS